MSLRTPYFFLKGARAERIDMGLTYNNVGSQQTNMSTWGTEPTPTHKFEIIFVHTTWWYLSKIVSKYRAIYVVCTLEILNVVEHEISTRDVL